MADRVMMAVKQRNRLIQVVLVLLAVTLCGSLGWLALLARDLPAVDALAEGFSVPSTYIYDRHGRLLYEVIDPAAGKHASQPLDEISIYMRQAVIATEDATFYQNPGFSPRGIVRSLWINLRSGRVVAGGSTITQQLVRNMLFAPEERYEQTLKRKIREALLAIRLTQRYSKDDILAFYLNQTYFGNFAFGAEAAAQAYFGQSASELTLGQAAMLAGMIQSPAAYNPLEDLEAARDRHRIVLGLMARRGYITDEQVELAAREPLSFASSPFQIEAPHFAMYVSSILERELGLDRMRQGGLRVYTTLDLDMQAVAQRVVTRRLAELSREDAYGYRPRVGNAALVAIDPHTGEILAMVGNPDYFDARVSGAINAALAPRQPGSALKPFTYAAAFEDGHTPATMILDVRTAFLTQEGHPFVPRNYDLRYQGPVLARQALGSSFNVSAVIMLESVGVDRLAAMMGQMGITTLRSSDHYGLSLTLGGGEVRLFELTRAYAGLAAGGRRVETTALRWVEDADGQLLRRWSGGPTAPVIDPLVAFLITDVLADDHARLAGFGEGSVLKLTRPAAVKTGTTTDWRDNWTIGYTPDLVTGVWVGNADNSPMWGVSGVSGAGPIWNDFMEHVLRGRPVEAFKRPEGLVEEIVCSLSGLRPNPDCPHRRKELFIAGTQPTRECAFHQRFEIDRATGLLAGLDTPSDRRQEVVYLVLPPEAHEWARDRGLPEPPLPAPSVASSSHVPSEVIRITSPDTGSVYRISPALPRTSQRIEVSVRTSIRFEEVELYAGTVLLGRYRNEPYSLRWPLQPGTHRIVARGLTPDGEWVESQPVWITVGQ